MKNYALLILVLVALAGCSTAYKGSIQGSNNPEAPKNGSYLVSQSGVVVAK
jgi:hypothetical protein